MAQALMVPNSRPYDPWGVFLVAIAGALFTGLIFPMDGYILAPYLFIGTLLWSLLGSIAFVWLVGLMFALILPIVDETDTRVTRAKKTRK